VGAAAQIGIRLERDDVRFAVVEAARFLGGQSFVSFTNKMHPLPTRQREHSRAGVQ
jgi:hypothetical protein